MTRTTKRSEQMGPQASRSWIVVLALSAAAPRAPAQWLDPDACVTCPDKRMHFAAGVGLALLAPGPRGAKSVHDPPRKRVLRTAPRAPGRGMLRPPGAPPGGQAGRPG